MATLTTIDGVVYAFRIDAVDAVADHDPSTGQVLTCVYGPANTPLKIDEAPEPFLARIGIPQDFVRFGRPGGSSIWINAKDVSSVRKSLPNEYASPVHSVIAVGGAGFGVVEASDTVVARLNAHGGAL